MPDRNAAEALRGARVFVPRSSFPTAGDDEYYWVDLIGLAVVNREGVALGTRARTARHRAADHAGAGRAEEDGKPVERLIPFVSAFVDKVDLAGAAASRSTGARLLTPAAAPMRFDVITLFPELFAPFLASGVTRRAFESGQVEVVLWKPRDFADGNYRRVDDRPFGGGPGMVMLAEPLAALPRRGAAPTRGAPAPVVLFSPTGEALRQALVERLVGRRGRGAAVRPLRGHRPALHRRARRRTS